MRNVIAYNGLILLLSLLLFYNNAICQDISKVKSAIEPEIVLGKNRFVTFYSNLEMKKSLQHFNGNEFIYGRVEFNSSLKSSLFLEGDENEQSLISILVEDITNKSSNYLSFYIRANNLDSNVLLFDLLPEPGKSLQHTNEFESGRFSFFIDEQRLEKRTAIFKITLGDAIGYLQIDFNKTDLKSRLEIDRDAWKLESIKRQ